MTPRDIITGLRAAGFWPRLPADGHEFIRTLPGPGVRTNLRAGAAAEEAMEAQYAGCIAFLRAEFQPWQPARCVIGDEIDEMLASAWPDAEPDTLGLLRGTLQTAAVVASMQLLVLLAAEGRA